MVLLRSEYEELKQEFLNKYHDEIKQILRQEKKRYMEEHLKDVNWLHFASSYMAGVILLLFVALVGIVKDAVTVESVIWFFVPILLVYSCTYSVWKKEMVQAAHLSFANKKHSVVSRFVYIKMGEDVQNSVIGVDFEKKVQFYSVALYEIPIEFHMDLFEKV